MFEVTRAPEWAKLQPVTVRIPWGKAVLMYIHSWVLRVNRSHLPEVLSLVTGLVLLGIGSSFFVSPESYTRSPTFVTAFSWASPAVWGATLTMVGTLLLAAALLRNLMALMGMSLVVTAVTSLFALAMTISVAGSGVPAAAWMWVGTSVVTAFTTIVYAAEVLEERK